MEVYLPQPKGEPLNWTKWKPVRKYPVLYLLHGFSSDENEYTRLSTIGRYIEDYPVVVIIPAVQRSVYVDIGDVIHYWTFLGEELPVLVQAYFPISDRRQDTFVAGISMGGYGAFKLGLSYPQRYAAAASFIGWLNFAQAAHQVPILQNDMQLNFGSLASQEGGPNDLFHLVRQMAASEGPKTRLYACTGTEDFVYPGNLAFKQLAESLGLDFTFEEGPGEHNWEYIDPMLPRMLKWLGLEPAHE